VTTSLFLDEPPSSATPTAYDAANVKLYLRLLDAEAQGAFWTSSRRFSGFRSTPSPSVPSAFTARISRAQSG